MSDDPAPTIVLTEEGDLPFQEYFVQRRTEPRVRGFRFDGSPQAALDVLQARESSDAGRLVPPTPTVSIDPMRETAGG